MASTLVVEDGSGREDANSYVTAAEAVAYAGARGNTAFVAATDAQRDVAMVLAADYLSREDRYPYRGLQMTHTQALPWPRVGVTAYRGQVIPDGVIPPTLKRAQIELALRAFAGVTLSPDLQRGGMVTSKKVGPISTTWSDKAPAETVYTLVDGLLRPLVRPGAPVVPPHYATGDVPSVFTPTGDASYANPLLGSAEG